MTLAARVRARLVADEREPTIANIARAVRGEGVVLPDAAVLELASTVLGELAGVGPLEALLGLPGVTDVVVNGPRDIWIDRGAGMERVDVHFTGVDDIRRLAQRLAASAGRRLDDAHPYVDARLPDGTRLHAVLPPIAVAGPCLSLRVPRRTPWSLDDLVAVGTIAPALADELRALIAGRRSFLVTGGTGSGKTTLLAGLLALVPHDERIVVVEDSSELDPDHPHCVRLQSRMANVEGAGAVSMRDLVRQALRMRPDRLVVGEVRGPEVIELLAALNTGHEGGCGTVHANSAADVPARLEALGLGAGVDRDGLHALAASGIDAIAHIQRDGGRRVVDGLHEVIAQDGRIRVRRTHDRAGLRCVA